MIDAAVQAERIEVRAPPSALAIEPGDIISFDDGADVADYFVASTEEGAARALTLLRATDGAFAIVSGAAPGAAAPPPGQPTRPIGEVLDLPLLAGQSERGGPMLAAAAAPWPGAVRVAAGETNDECARLVAPAGVGELAWDLYPGPVGRWDQGNVVRVRMHHGALSSAEQIEVFAGANALAVEGAEGWEIVQFETAALVETGLYEISGLLRGQRGSDPEMGAPRLAGARVVVLDGALETFALNEHERGAALEWRFAGAGASLTGDQAYVVTASDARIDERPLSPVHLRMKRSAAGVAFTWIRRSRLGGDDWDAAEIPLGEDVERYLFQLHSGGEIVLSRETTAAETFLTLAEEAALFDGAPLFSFDISVAQLSARYGAGAERRAVVYA